MANSSNNQKVVSEAREALNKFKYEVASDMCVKNVFKLAVEAMPITDNLCNGANGDVVYIFKISSSYFIFIYAIF